MTPRPLVSVVIPVYNGERFLGDAIRSVLEQSYGPVQCVVVDDGSSDGSRDIARSFAPDVECVVQRNQGVSAARNAGIAATRGELVAFLDADDVWEARKLELQVPEVVGRDVGMAYSGFRVVDGDLRPRYEILPSGFDRRLLGAALMNGYGFGFSFTALVTRDVIDRCGPFDTRLSVSADLDYVLRLAQITDIVGVAHALALYRIHGRSQMHNDVALLEHDHRLILDQFFPDGDMYVRRHRHRGIANRHLHIAAGLASEGAFQSASRHALTALRTSPWQVVALPAAASRRRVVRRVLRRWPAARPKAHSSDRLAKIAEGSQLPWYRDLTTS